MAKRKQHTRQMKQSGRQEVDTLQVADALDDDVLQQLRAAKQQLTQAAAIEEAAEKERLQREREAREKNKSFAELLDAYGNQGDKYQ